MVPAVLWLTYLARGAPAEAGPHEYDVEAMRRIVDRLFTLLIVMEAHGRLGPCRLRDVLEAVAGRSIATVRLRRSRTAVVMFAALEPRHRPHHARRACEFAPMTSLSTTFGGQAAIQVLPNRQLLWSGQSCRRISRS